MNEWTAVRAVPHVGRHCRRYPRRDISNTSLLAGSASEAAAVKKSAKYATIAANHIFTPVAVETRGTICDAATEFLSGLGRRIALISNEPRETNYLFQRVSVLIQRYNAVAFRGSFEEAETES